MRHTKPERTALERNAAEQNRLIADVAASVNAMFIPCLHCITESRCRQAAVCLILNPESNDEDAILDAEPREIPLTEAQKRTEDWMERATEDEAWREEPEDD